MRVLVHNRWPGNVDQLAGVLRRIVAKRRSGVIELRDLPPECWATGKRVLTPLESIECDAIIACLKDPDTYASLRDGAGRVALEFSLDDHVAALLRVLDDATHTRS